MFQELSGENGTSPSWKPDAGGGEVIGGSIGGVVPSMISVIVPVKVPSILYVGIALSLEV